MQLLYYTIRYATTKNTISKLKFKLEEPWQPGSVKYIQISDRLGLSNLTVVSMSQVSMSRARLSVTDFESRQWATTLSFPKLPSLLAQVDLQKPDKRHSATHDISQAELTDQQFSQSLNNARKLIPLWGVKESWRCRCFWIKLLCSVTHQTWTALLQKIRPGTIYHICQNTWHWNFSKRNITKAEIANAFKLVLVCFPAQIASKSNPSTRITNPKKRIKYYNII